MTIFPIDFGRRYWLISLAMLGVAAAASGPAGAASNTEQVRQDGTCADANGRPEILVRVSGFRNQKGGFRVNVYNGNPEEFLKKGKKIVRVDTPVAGDQMEVCVWVAREGNYALVVMHDINANGKYNWTKDGAGASNNPKPRLGKPKYKEVAFKVGPGRTELDISLHYLFAASKN